MSKKNEDREDRQEEVVETTEIAKIELVERAGICEYCKQMRMVKVPENMSDIQVNEIATQECDCKTAEFMRRRKMRLDAAGMWITNALEGHEKQQKLMTAAVNAVFGKSVYKVTIKLDGHKTAIVDLDKEDMIRIKTVYKNENEETF